MRGGFAARGGLALFVGAGRPGAKVPLVRQETDSLVRSVVDRLPRLAGHSPPHTHLHTEPRAAEERHRADRREVRVAEERHVRALLRVQLAGVMVQRGNEVLTADTGTWNTAAQTWTLTGAWVVRSGGAPEPVPGLVTLPQKDTLAPPRPEADQLSSARLRADLTDPELQGAERRTLEHQLASRTADSFTAVIFALAAGLLGLLMPNRAWAFAAVLLVIVVYYVPWTMGPQLAAGGALSPALVAWLPNLIFIVLAAALAWRLR